MQSYFAPIRLLPNLVPLLPSSSQVARRRMPLDQVICGERMDYILGPSLRHMAIGTAAGAGMPAFRHRPAKLAGMAILASCIVMSYRRLSSRRLVRIVTCPALHRA